MILWDVTPCSLVYGFLRKTVTEGRYNFVIQILFLTRELREEEAHSRPSFCPIILVLHLVKKESWYGDLCVPQWHDLYAVFDDRLTANVAVEWLAFLLQIREVPPLNLGLEIGCLDWGVSWNSLRHIRHSRYLELLSSGIWRHIVW